MTDYKSTEFQRSTEYKEDERGLYEEFTEIQHRDSHVEALNRHALAAGPNDWKNVTKEDFGDVYDYQILEEIPRASGVEGFVIYPTCRAALQWCYRFLPSDCPRWGFAGFIIDEPRDSMRGQLILTHMAQCGLVSEDDALSAEDNDKRAGE